MNVAHFAKAGALYDVVKGTPPAAVSAGTRNGAAINRIGFRSLTLHAATGAETGSPSARTVNAKIQDSADGSTGWADYVPPGSSTAAAVAEITAANAEAEVDVDLAGAKAYVRVVEVTAFTGGTSPTLGVATTVVLGGPESVPA
jgi:hypothetical protein